MYRIAWLVLLCVLSGATAQGQVTSLLTNNPIDRTIKSGESHLYQLTLAAGECAILELDANKAYVNWEVWVEKGKALAGSDLEKATKKIWLVAEPATTYFLRIKLAGTPASGQSYCLRIAEQRPATEADRNIVQAQSDQLQAINFYGLDNEDSHRQAVKHSRQAAERWEAAGSTIDAAVNYNLLGLSLQRLDEISNATLAYERALKRFKALGNREQEANTTNNLAGLLLRAGEPQQALNYLGSIQETENQRIPALQIGRAFVFSGTAYRLLGDLTKARSFLELGLQFLRTPEKNVYVLNAESRALFELGQICLNLGDHSQAQAHLWQSLAVIKENDFLFRTNSGLIRRAIGDVHFSRGGYLQAQEAYRETLTNFQQVAGPFHRASIRNDLGAAALARGNLKEAQEWYAEALTLNESLNNVAVALAAQVGLARVARQCGDNVTALARIEQAVHLIESQRARIVSPDLRASFLATKREVYELHVELLAQLGEQETSAARRAAAFAASEQSRARSLLELLSANAGQMLETTEPQLAKRDRELRQKISLKADQQTRLTAKPVTPEQQARLNNELALLLAEHDRLTTQWRQRDPRYAALTDAQPLTLQEIQQQVLDDKTLLLEYALGTERSWLFAVTRTTLHSFPLPPRRELEQAARALYQLLEARATPPTFRSITEAQGWRAQQEQKMEPIAQQLSQMLLTPVRELMPGKRLLIVPDGALHYVPFAALPVVSRQSSVASRQLLARQRATGNKRQPTDNGQPLIVQHELLTLPSASTLAVLRREWNRRGQAAKTLAVFADPVFASNDERVTTTPAATRDNTASDSAGLVRLPSSRREAEALAALVAEPQRKLALDFAAQRAAVQNEDLSQYRYVHFATHGLLNNEHPELLALALSLVNQQGVEQDGLLRTMDVFKLKLNAELVVLSGCQTALGKEINGEGLIGLTRGFMYAGARRVVASLWQVSDAATAELMQRFYQGMLGEKKLAPAAALRAAQLAMFRNPRWQSLYYWAAFTVQGEW